jgi:hypothetical protein
LVSSSLGCWRPRHFAWPIFSVVLTSPQITVGEHWVSAWATAQEDYVSLENDRRLGERPFMTSLHDQISLAIRRLTLTRPLNPL